MLPRIRAAFESLHERQRLTLADKMAHRTPWHVIIAVDQSDPMLDSAIFSAVMASVFYELPSVRTSLFLFDTPETA